MIETGPVDFGDHARVDPVDDLMDEQIRYYRARAPEYDATSRPEGDPFAAITAQAVEALRRLGPVEHAIELGAGTGTFTSIVAEVARHVTAVDSSAEMLELNRAKVPAPQVERVVADVFDWRPARPAQLIVFTFLLSHIPRERFEAFWDVIGRSVTPDGRAFLMDESAHARWREEQAMEPGAEIVRRTLIDGRIFRVVKVLWDPAELAERLAGIGWQARFERSDPFFWGTVGRR